ncbi:MAG: HAD family phosphatase [Nanoarchaeota archaeon]|nr:HAD family phosphatase [Nanoarchaeota archaeon]
MKSKAVICDMDGTAVQYSIGDFSSSWDALASILSDEERTKWFSLIKEHYGKGDYRFWFQAQVDLLKGKKLADAERVLFPIPYSLGFREFFSNSNGLKRAILSAGINIVAKKIAEEFGFDYWLAQHLEVCEGIFTGRGESTVDYQNKSNYLLRVSEFLGIPLSRTCYIGDTEGDIGCMELVGTPVAFNPHHGLEKYAKQKRIPVISDFRQLNEILRENEH